jgi:hypothetical protein
LEAKGARIGAWLTFKGQTEKSMELRTASSFTGKENAISNLEKEVDNLASSFDEKVFFLSLVPGSRTSIMAKPGIAQEIFNEKILDFLSHWQASTGET